MFKINISKVPDRFHNQYIDVRGKAYFIQKNSAGRYFTYRVQKDLKIYPSPSSEHTMNGVIERLSTGFFKFITEYEVRNQVE